MKIKPNMPILVVSLLLASVSVCMGLGIFAHYFNRDLYRATKEISANWIPSINLLSDMRSDIALIRRAEASTLFSGDVCPMRDCAAALAQSRKKLEDDEIKYFPLIGPPEERLLFDSYRLQKAIYFQQSDELLKREEGNAAAVQKFLSESAQQFESTAELLDRLIDYNGAQGERSQAAVQKYYQTSQTYLAITNLILGITAAFLVVRLLILVVL